MKKIGKLAIISVVVLILVGLIVGIILFSSEKHPAYLLNGTIVLPDQILEDGWLIIKNNKIEAISEEKPILSQTREIVTDGIILPGLVDIHNHISWNTIPRWDPDQYFDNRYEWRRNYEPYQPIVTIYSAIVEDYFCEINTYSEAKALVGGSTTTLGTYSQWCIRGLVRNLDHFTGFYFTSIMQDKKHIRNIIDLPSNPNDTLQFIENNQSEAVFFHLAEGIDLASRAEFEKLDKLGLLTEKTVIIHGTALVPEQFDLMAERGAALAWSPRSNLELYGTTTDISAAVEASVPVAITPDWSITGSANIMDELRVAADWNQIQMDGLLTDEDLFHMVTSIPAQIAGIDEFVGTIQEGLYADLLIIGGDASQPYTSLLQAQPEDVKMVIVDGIPMYGDADLITQVMASEEYSEVEIGNTVKLLRVKHFDTLIRTLTDIMGNNGYTLAPLVEDDQPTVPDVTIKKENLIIDSPVTEQIDWDQAEFFFGQEKIVCGEIIDSYFSAEGAQITYLYMGKPFPDIDRFSIVIFKNDREKFVAEPEITYLGETVCVAGEIVTYEGGAEIILTDPVNLSLP